MGLHSITTIFSGDISPPTNREASTQESTQLASKSLDNLTLDFLYLNFYELNKCRFSYQIGW
jgi:hypothetical protein